MTPHKPYKDLLAIANLVFNQLDDLQQDLFHFESIHMDIPTHIYIDSLKFTRDINKIVKISEIKVSGNELQNGKK